MTEVTNTPIRVLMLFTILNRGGAESMVMNYYRPIDRSKVQFDFVVHREEKGAFEDEILSLGGKIYRMMPLRPHLIPVYKKQISAFFDSHPEYHIIHGQCSESGYFFYKEAYKRGIPVIVAHAHNSHVKFDLKLIFRTWMKHQMRPYLTHYFACGKEAAEWLFGKELATKAIIQTNAIDTYQFVFRQEIRFAKRIELGISNGTKVICHVGRFDPVKNHRFILDIFEAFLRNHQDAMLILIGDGMLQKQMEEKTKKMGIERNVMFLGTRGDVHELLQAADVFLFPSIFEGLPVSLIEAQCTGLPCLISQNIPREVMVTDIVEQLSLNNDANSWANKLWEMLNKPNRRSEYAQNVANSGYDIHKNAEWLQNFYLNAVK